MQRAELVSVGAGARIVQDAARGLALMRTAPPAGRHTSSASVLATWRPRTSWCAVDGVAKIADFFGSRFALERLEQARTVAVPGTLPYRRPSRARMQPVDAACRSVLARLVLVGDVEGLRLFRARAIGHSEELLRMPILPPSSYRPGSQASNQSSCRMLAANPDERFANMADVVEALDAAVPGLSGDGRPPARADAVSFQSIIAPSSRRASPLRAVKDEGGSAGQRHRPRLCTAPGRTRRSSARSRGPPSVAVVSAPTPTRLNPPRLRKRRTRPITRASAEPTPPLPSQTFTATVVTPAQSLMESRAEHFVAPAPPPSSSSPSLRAPFIATSVAMAAWQARMSPLTRAGSWPTNKRAGHAVRAVSSPLHGMRSCRRRRPTGRRLARRHQRARPRAAVAFVLQAAKRALPAGPRRRAQQRPSTTTPSRPRRHALLLLAHARQRSAGWRRCRRA